MTLRDWFRNLISGPPHVHDTTDDAGEVAATLGEEYDAPAAHEDTAKEMELGSHLPRNTEAAGAAADDLESTEAPPDTDP
jgi:hypothetical protein